MKKLIVYNIISLIFISQTLAQSRVSGFVYDEVSGSPIENVAIFNNYNDKTFYSDLNGYFDFNINKNSVEIIFYSEGYRVLIKNIESNSTSLIINLSSKVEELNEVVVRANRKKIFQIKRMKDYEGTYVYAGKKNEVILLELSMANLASNNSRQIYNQIPGLNIYQNDDAGLQLNIGGRGLDPNRTSNFNTRQNDYDISADALGYPESYYTPPAEGLQEIQILRGAASLQYGTQFGGLINFIMKKPNYNKSLEVITRNTTGSNNLFTNFTSLSSTGKKVNYYSYVNYKKGNGFRDNSNFESTNTFHYLEYKINDKTLLSSEFTYLNYLAQQAGGLSDEMFKKDHLQSNRARNWFEVKWMMYNLKFKKEFSNNTNFSFSFFGLEAKRNSLGFRTNRVSQVDSGEERDLIKGDFSNFGIESRLLTKYSLLNKKSLFLVGMKYYNSNSSSVQGPGSNGLDANFSFQNSLYPNYNSQSNYNYPNENIAIFAENIIYLNDKISLTPGLRYENIITKSEGFYKKINLDGAGNVIYNEKFEENDKKNRNFLLVGLGFSYKVNRKLELYSNFSENYRSVTFADISTINPAYAINPEIDDEKGYTFDIGLRGNYKKKISFDANIFLLKYEDRIGFIQKVFSDGNVKSERGNVGNAKINGIESLFDFDLNEIFLKNNDLDLNYFINYSYINSKYLKSNQVGIEGNSVEFVPKHNLKTGIKFGYKNLLLNFQYSYVSKQFTDSSNAIDGNLSGVIGQIPEYGLADLSISYKIKNVKVETGVNNLFNEKYFTRRATGYPGPGIIPSAPINTYLTLEIKF
jgi:Fe(3+) dicitrate transport protein